MDDLTFGADVWATPDPVEQPAPPSESKRKPPAPLNLEDDDFDDAPFNDFDDFGAPAEAAEFDTKDDDFGDFEDFEEASEIAPAPAFQGTGFGEPSIAGPSGHRPWQPLQVDPVSSFGDLQEEVYEILDPIWAAEDISRIATDDPMREVEGVGQILVTPSSRQVYKMLLEPPSSSRPPNWTRSRIRRQHLISLGIPVNLDEVLPKANGRSLPMLEVHTRPMSAPPGAFKAPTHSNHPSRSGTPVSQGPQSNLVAQFGPKPDLETSKIRRLLDLDPDYLKMQPLANLERVLNDLRIQTANTSNVLTYLLQSRDALQQDSETYNGLIANLVSEMAQKVKSGKPPSRSMSRHGR
ncbi:hypothetical protein DFP72DRAFT_878193 [Ephemerocybe angulata]|uniref:Uncharacterized protein n=1 Tax=Ephemerocybe angulata TaxID=980116 RepID=A0A8H6IAY4_9AGAR|nr:hypothetical protein DFP72DRAFT_878193 [Tulosesus angulatus]